VKAISWRAIATFTGFGIVFALTGEIGDAAGFAVLDILLKLVFYYMHERGWSMVEWGVISPDTPELTD
jgi:uncharacterized membrane protein